MVEYYDFASVKAKLGEVVLYSFKFPLNPTSMETLMLPVALRWEQIPFDRRNATSIIKKPGVYAFAVTHSRPGLPPHGYILYIGQVGAKEGKTRTLRARFKEYLHEKVRPGRKHVAYFLNAWETCLVFHFAVLDPSTVDLLDIEMKLNDAMMPPFSRGDFSPEIREMKRFAEMF